jgi:hypothetical protein
MQDNNHLLRKMGNPNPTVKLPPLPRADNTSEELAGMTGVRLPVHIDKTIRALPNRTAWLRRVITEAAQRELMGDKS